MTQDKKEYYSIQELLSIIRVQFFTILKSWPILLLFVVIGAGLGYLYYKVQKPKFRATSVFILEEKSIGGGLSGIASQFGIDMGMLGGGGTNIFSGDNILEILKSKSIIKKVLLSDFITKDSTKLVDAFIVDYNIINKWNASEDFKRVNFYNVESGLTNLQDSALNIVYERIIEKHISVERINKKGSIIEVIVNSKNKDFSRLFCLRVIDEAKKLYLQLKTTTATSNIDRLQRKADSLLYLLNKQTFRVAITQLNDANAGYRSSIVPVEIASRDKTVLATIYTEVVKNLETSKLLLAQQTPVIQVIDIPQNALFDNKLSLPVSILIFMCGSFVITTCFIVGRNFMKKMYR